MEPLIFVLALLVLVVLLLALWPRRADLVALVPVLALTLAGILTPVEAFGGFVSSAVVVLIAALVLARGIFATGVLDRLADAIARRARTPAASLGGILLATTAVSAFFSDTGTLLIMLPVAHRLCRRFGLSPGKVMMPLAFSSLLSSAVTLTSSSSNLVIASYASRAGVGELGLFALAPAGLAVTAAGLVVLLLLAPRLLPQGAPRGAREQELGGGEYLTEVRVVPGGPLVGARALGLSAGAGLPPVTAVRRGGSLFSPTEELALRGGDVLLLRLDPGSLREVTLAEGLALAEAGPPAADLLEVVVPPGSALVGRTIAEAALGEESAAVVGVSRQGLPATEDLAGLRLQVGDVLLVRGSDEGLRRALRRLGCLPLEDRGVVVFHPSNTLKALAIFGLVVGLAVSQLLSVAVAFALGAFAAIAVGLVSVREAYAAIDWPLVVLVGGLLSLGTAMEKSGVAGFLAGGILGGLGGAGPVVLVAFLLLVALALTSVMNNAAVAALLAPIALLLARGGGLNPLTLLAAVAVGCSLSFLLPYSHPCNLLVQGPGGYGTGDYLRLGLAVVAAAVPAGLGAILLAWPP